MKLSGVAIFSIALLLSSCADWEGRQKDMELAFHGKHIDDVIRTLGVPTRRAILSDGSQVVEFITYRNNFQCEEKFITNTKGIVISSQHGGQNGCATP